MFAKQFKALLVIYLALALLCVGSGALFAASCSPAEANSEVISGIVNLIHWGWDFSEQVSTTGPFEGDMFIAIVVDPPLGWRVAAGMPPALIVVIPDSTYEELQFAPADTSVYSFDAPADVGYVYVIRTVERHYAKMRLIQCDYGAIIMEYTYQPDGSRRLFNEIGVESTSWGKIKALYR
jgi:hypothetical protein